MTANSGDYQLRVDRNRRIAKATVALNAERAANNGWDLDIENGTAVPTKLRQGSELRLEINT